MASSGKKKTTMAKLTRESTLRQRRLDKRAKKDARKHAPADDPGTPDDTQTPDPTADVSPKLSDEDDTRAEQAASTATLPSS